MTLEQRIEITRAALREIGRGDLADLIHDAFHCRRMTAKHRPNDGKADRRVWHSIPWSYNDNLLIRRAKIVAVASLDGYHAPAICDPCMDVPWPRRNECARITVSDYLIGRVCALHASAATHHDRISAW